MPGATSVYTSKAYRGFDKKLKVSGEMSEWLKEHAWTMYRTYKCRGRHDAGSDKCVYVKSVSRVR